jgi:threonine/homoserine/homoserine lactone efflux protein
VLSSNRQVIFTGILVNVLNPKLTIFFLAFLPQFVDPDSPNSFLRMIGLSGVFLALTFVTFIVYGAFAAAIRSKVLARPRVSIGCGGSSLAGSWPWLSGLGSVTERTAPIGCRLRG